MSASPGPTFVIAERIDVTKYNSAVLILRIHSINLGDGQFSFSILMDGFTEDDGPLFSLLQTPFVLDVTSTAGLRVAGFDPLGEYLAIGISAFHVDPAKPFVGEFSMDLILRNPDDTVGSEIRENYWPLLQPLFDRWGLDLSTVRVEVMALAGRMEAKTLSEEVIAVSPRVLTLGNGTVLFRTLAHELAHVVQIRRLGTHAAIDREVRELSARSRDELPRQLREIALAAIDPVDPRFTLEAISKRVAQAAQEMASFVGADTTCRCSCKCKRSTTGSQIPCACWRRSAKPVWIDNA